MLLSLMGYFHIYYFSGIFISFLYENFGNEFRERKQNVTKKERNKYKRIYPFLGIVFEIWPMKVLSYFVICFCLRGMCGNVAVMGFLHILVCSSCFTRTLASACLPNNLTILRRTSSNK